MYGEEKALHDCTVSQECSSGEHVSKMSPCHNQKLTGFNLQTSGKPQKEKTKGFQTEPRRVLEQSSGWNSNQPLSIWLKSKGGLRWLQWRLKRASPGKTKRLLTPMVRKHQATINCKGFSTKYYTWWFYFVFICICPSTNINKHFINLIHNKMLPCCV